MPFGVRRESSKPCRIRASSRASQGVESSADKVFGLDGEGLFDFVNGHLLRVGEIDYRIMNDERVIAPLQNARCIGVVAKGCEVDADGFAGVIVDFSDDDPKVFGCLGRFGKEESIPAFERQSISPLCAEVIHPCEIV